MTLTARKPLADLQLTEDGRPTLPRALGPLHLTTLGIGSVIGTGIFVLTGTAASQHAGPVLVLSMIIAAMGCALAGLCYAELAAMIPVAGSAYAARGEDGARPRRKLEADPSAPRHIPTVRKAGYRLVGSDSFAPT